MKLIVKGNQPFGWRKIALSDAGVYYESGNEIGYIRNDSDCMETWPRSSTTWKHKLTIKGFKHVGRQNKGGSA